MYVHNIYLAHITYIYSKQPASSQLAATGSILQLLFTSPPAMPCRIAGSYKNHVQFIKMLLYVYLSNIINIYEYVDGHVAFACCFSLPLLSVLPKSYNSANYI